MFDVSYWNTDLERIIYTRCFIEVNSCISMTNTYLDRSTFNNLRNITRIDFRTNMYPFDISYIDLQQAGSLTSTANSPASYMLYSLTSSLHNDQRLSTSSNCIISSSHWSNNKVECMQYW